MSHKKKATSSAEIEAENSAPLDQEIESFESLKVRILELEEQLEEKKNTLLRTLAEAENLRKRTEREIASAHKYANERFARDLLIVVDNLERCLNNKVESSTLQNVYQGVELTLKSLLDTLKAHGIQEIEAMNQPFNPAHHNAVTTRITENITPNTVIEVIQKGYWLKDRVLRPAVVVVAQ